MFLEEQLFYLATVLLSTLLIFVLHNAMAFILFPRIFRNRISKSAYYVGAAIGTPVHELSHAVMCILFRHKITDTCFFTLRNKDNLGYVQHSYNTKSVYQLAGCFFIAIAPLVTAMSVIFLFLSSDLQQLSYSFSYGSQPIQIYNLAVSVLSLIANKEHGITLAVLISLLLFYCVPSVTDFKNAARSLIVVGLVIFLAYVAVAMVDTYFIEVATPITRALQTLAKLTVITVIFYSMVIVVWVLLALLTVVRVKPKKIDC